MHDDGTKEAERQTSLCNVAVQRTTLRDSLQTKPFAPDAMRYVVKYSCMGNENPKAEEIMQATETIRSSLVEAKSKAS